MDTGGPADRLIDGRFELLQRLGGGGMGVVWKARDTALHREVALKEVRPPDPAVLAADPAAAHELRERVLREARALARLQHPNVATIHHIVDTPDLPHPWLVMELVPGGSLADRIADGPLKAAEAARIGRGVLAALRAAHAAGIQHRDVKPGNVLLRLDGTPVLTDFGIAAMTETSSLTATGALIGSPEYIAPERIRGNEGDPASDLWSLGMTLYVAVEGHHPLRRATTFATLAAVLDEPLPPPIHAGPLGPVLARMLGRDPATRPDGAELDRLLAAAEQGPAIAYSSTERDTGRPTITPGPPADPSTPWPTGGQQPGTPWPATGMPAAGAGTPWPAQSATGQPTPWPAQSATGQPTPWPAQSATGQSTPWPAQSPTAGGAFQGPTAGSAWAGGPTSPYDAHPPVPPRKRGGLTTVALATAAVVVAAGLVWTFTRDGGYKGRSNDATATQSPGGQSTGNGTGAGSSGGGSAKPSSTPKTTTGKVDLLTPAGLNTAVAALEAQMGGSKVDELVVYPEYASAKAPTTTDAKFYDTWQYRNGRAAKLEHFSGTFSSSDKIIDLSVYDWNVVPSLIEQAEKTLNIPNPTSRYLIIDAWSEGQPTIRVYLSDAYGGSYLAADRTGKVLRAVPR
ncbi:protein kinase [Kitasatospora sp. NPDC048365]|uniref:serine/threonine-protein kinase n=1 Tax=Kitasatospora sp. NPDC048365 TaxID=3364050 RepID=UPI00370FCF48